MRLHNDEIRRISVFLGLEEICFIQRFTRLGHNRQGLALEERGNGECVFLEGNNCAVQPVKPQQCRDFPNLWTFPGAELKCKAIPRQVGTKDYRKLILAATGREQASH